MKIAFVLPSESNPLHSLYLDHVKRSCEVICELGYEATILSSAPIPDELMLFDTVSYQPLASLPVEARNRYQTGLQAEADHLLSALLDDDGVCEYDVVEFPLWEGVAFSVIRSKRLLGFFKDTKLVVNVDLSQLLLEHIDDEYLPNYETELVSHMELYALRYADQLQTGIGAYESVVRSISGRKDLQFYEPLGLAEAFDEIHSKSRELAILKSWTSEMPASEQIQSLEGLLQLEGRRVYGRKKTSSTVTFFVPYHEEMLEGGLNQIETLIDEEGGDVVYFNLTDADSYAEFSPEIGRKSNWDPTVQSFDVLLNESSTDYVLFAQVGAESALYLNLATCALNKNPDLAYVGAYLGGQPKYGVGYVPSLSRLVNVACPIANVFRKSALEKIASDITVKDCIGFEWELMVALDDKYQVGDLIPSVFFDVPQNDESCLNARDILRSRKRLGGAKAVRALTLLVESPELLGMKDSSEEFGSFDWDFRLPFDLKVDTEVSELVHGEELPEESALEGLDEEDELPKLSADDAINSDGFEEPLQLADEEDDSEDHSEEAIRLSEASKALLEMEKSLAEEYPVDQISESDDDDDDDEEDFPEEPVLTIQYSLGKDSTELDDDLEAFDSEAFDSEAFDPEAVDPEAFDPEVVDLEAVDSEAVDPEAVDSEAVDSEAVDPEAVDSEAVDSEAFDSEAVDSEAFDSEAVDPEAFDSEVVDSGIVDEISSESTTLSDETFDNFQLFWGKDFGFSEVESIKKEALLGDALYIEFSVENSDFVNTLRLDPCNREGIVHLRKIQVVDDSTGLTVFSSCEENAFDHIQPTGDFDVEGVEEDALLLQSHGTDPQILVTLGDLLLQRFTVRVEYGYEN